jgi:hypothetical protein
LRLRTAEAPSRLSHAVGRLDGGDAAPVEGAGRGEPLCATSLPSLTRHEVTTSQPLTRYTDMSENTDPWTTMPDIALPVPAIWELDSAVRAAQCRTNGPRVPHRGRLIHAHLTVVVDTWTRMLLGVRFTAGPLSDDDLVEFVTEVMRNAPPETAHRPITLRVDHDFGVDACRRLTALGVIVRRLNPPVPALRTVAERVLAEMLAPAPRRGTIAVEPPATATPTMSEEQDGGLSGAAARPAGPGSLDHPCLITTAGTTGQAPTSPRVRTSSSAEARADSGAQA